MSQVLVPQPPNTPQALTQKPREEGQLEKESVGIQIISVKSKIRSISIGKSGRESRDFEDRPFDFDVSLTESTRTKDTLTVNYSFAFGRHSSGQVCKILGSAVVRFSGFNPGSDFHYLGNDFTNEIAVEIFRKNYELVYLLHHSLAMDAPSPWITQDVSLSSHNQLNFER
jgi:hypothetical protein